MTQKPTLEGQLTEGKLTPKDLDWIERSALPQIRQPLAKLVILMLLLHIRRYCSTARWGRS